MASRSWAPKEYYLITNHACVSEGKNMETTQISKLGKEQIPFNVSL